MLLELPRLVLMVKTDERVMNRLSVSFQGSNNLLLTPSSTVISWRCRVSGKWPPAAPPVTGWSP